MEYRAHLLMDMRMANIDHASKLITEIFQEARIRKINHQILDVICIDMKSDNVQMSLPIIRQFVILRCHRCIKKPIPSRSG